MQGTTELLSILCPDNHIIFAGTKIQSIKEI